jgi:uncharacterized protein (PEP-CTERM system associated)
MGMAMGMGTDMAARSFFRAGSAGLAGTTIVGILAGIPLSASAGTWTITPSVAVRETATDNARLSDKNKESDLISDISPGILVEGAGGRSKLRFDYQMHNLVYASDSSRNKTQHALNAFGTLEALEDWFFIDASGMISQQSISPFGGAPSSGVNTNGNDNSTQTATYRLSPYIRGTLGGFADYQLRYNLTTTSSAASQANDSDTKQLVGTLKGVTALASLGWSVDASSQEVNFDNGRSNEADRLRGVLTYQINPQFRVSLIGGREANDYLTTDKKSYTTKGAGFDWSPTERTLVSASREDRFFGKSNTFSVSHRTAGSAWKYTETKDASVQTNQQSADLTIFDLLSAALSSLSEEDRKKVLDDFFNTPGAPPRDAQVPGGFLTNAVTLQHRRQLSFALLGARNTVTFTASRSESENLSEGAGTGILIGTDFVDVRNVRQRLISVNWSHKLTAMSSLVGSVSRLNSTGSGNTSLETTQQTYSLDFTTKLGPNTSAGFGARHIVVDGTTNYTENALTGVLSHRF